MARRNRGLIWGLFGLPISLFARACSPRAWSTWLSVIGYRLLARLILAASLSFADAFGLSSFAGRSLRDVCNPDLRGARNALVMLFNVYAGFWRSFSS